MKQFRRNLGNQRFRHFRVWHASHRNRRIGRRHGSRLSIHARHESRGEKGQPENNFYKTVHKDDF